MKGARLFHVITIGWFTGLEFDLGGYDSKPQAERALKRIAASGTRNKQRIDVIEPDWLVPRVF